MKDSFSHFTLNDELMKSIKELGFKKPTPIQSKVIPHLLDSNQDLIATAQTGTGKTEYLLRKVEKKLEEGVKPNRIGYFAYTVKAANEARTRAINKFTNLDKKDFIYFRTLHSLAFKQLGLSKILDLKIAHKSTLIVIHRNKKFKENFIEDLTFFEILEDNFLEKLVRKIKIYFIWQPV